MFQVEELSREQTIAVQELEKCITQLRSPGLVEEELTLERLTTEGSAFFLSFRAQTSDLPRESFWIWNQSRGRKQITSIDGSLSVQFYKLNTRKSRTFDSLETIPQYKVWIFNISKLSGNEEKSFIWCERGENPNVLDARLLAQLSFLEPYVSLSCAEECGWGFREILSNYDMLHL